MENYTILTFEEADRIRQLQKLQIKYQVPENYAIVYETMEQQILLFPAKGSKVVLFNDERVMNEVIYQTGIPIESDHFFVRHKTFILSWEVNSHQALSSLSTKIQFDLSQPLRFEDIDLLSTKLTLLLKGMDKEAIFETYYLSFAAVLGKVIIDNVEHAEWKLFQYYDINPYFEPDVVINGKKTHIFDTIGDDMARNKVRFANSLNRIGIKYG